MLYVKIVAKGGISKGVALSEKGVRIRVEFPNYIIVIANSNLSSVGYVLSTAKDWTLDFSCSFPATPNMDRVTT